MERFSTPPTSEMDTALRLGSRSLLKMNHCLNRFFELNINRTKKAISIKSLELNINRIKNNINKKPRRPWETDIYPARPNLRSAAIGFPFNRIRRAARSAIKAGPLAYRIVDPATAAICPPRARPAHRPFRRLLIARRAAVALRSPGW
jgi:hypothetical protein